MQGTEIKQTAVFLSQIPFFSEVSKTSLEHLCEKLDTTVFRKKESIFEKGDPGDAMFVILGGKVRVHENSHVYGHMSEGECFGEYALIDNKERSASVTAVEETTLLRIERQHFVDLMLNDSGFAQGILAVMIKRHRELDSIQENLASSREALQLANSKMSGLINGAMDAIIMFDSSFKIILTNPSANLLLENEDVHGRNILFFLDDAGAEMLEKLVGSEAEDEKEKINNYLPQVVRVIGSAGKEVLNEGTISMYGNEKEHFYTLILRNIEDRLIAEDKINLLTTQAAYLEEEIKELTSNYGIVTGDPAMKAVLNAVEQVAGTDATTLINGETGTGKELVARAIHRMSKRNDKALIRINCGAIPANLIESELFGHEKGAFTGAVSSRKGRFLLADGGTIFLDEIGELPLELQPKLLRVIQEGEFDPVGSSETIKVDVRIIAATHRDLLSSSREGKFREDLYYRLNVFPVKIPALRERGNDVCLIAREMIDQFSTKLNKKPLDLSEADKALFLSYNWPGNVRELQNLVERAVIVSRNGKVNWTDIVPHASAGKTNDTKQDPERILTSEELIELEKENILKALKMTNWKVSGKNGAAALLKLPPTTLASRIKALGISRPV
ncbi:cyclic nucleotide-binding domain-containing protein [Leptobacterium flavescens]|uniref:Cyclic nucleotide-binding domain-containing protein n=1 Tax=Leptobacterium flavescens TaxID=472055 RepID=A0A6P0UGU2_9FLAO|nr:sigma 54-interacting transcriptional regulator [Leptobacterium flavescens]NER11852.1 cyclic nucleotide-binding domain-containing protein [Leptobacterium flavescens]